jgi:hypothetical protein
MRDESRSTLSFTKKEWNVAAPLVVCGLNTWFINMWVFFGAYLSPFLLAAWFIRHRRQAFTRNPTLLGIFFGLFGVLMSFVPSYSVYQSQRLFPVLGFGSSKALAFLIAAFSVGVPLTLFVARRHGSRTAFLFVLGFLAPTVNWAFWEISYGAPPLGLPAYRLESQLPGSYIFILAFIAALASQRASRNQTRLAIFTATLTTCVLAFGGILGRSWLLPRIRLSYDPAFAPHYLLVYGVAVAALLLPALINPFAARKESAYP